MRRIIALFIILITFSCSCISLAEIPDPHVLSDSELIELMYLVNQEVANRRIEKTAELAAGDYIIGVDIPAGTYTALGIGTKLNDSISVFEYDTEYEMYDLENLYFLHDDEAVHFTLSEGQKIKATCAFSLTISAGIQFH